MTFGDRVRQAREHAGLSQAELARLVGVSRSAIYQLESGTSKSANATNHQKIAEKTGVRPEWLLTGRGSMANTSRKVDPPVNPMSEARDLHSQGSTTQGDVMREDEEIMRYVSKMSAIGKSRALCQIKVIFAEDQIGEAPENPTKERA